MHQREIAIACGVTREAVGRYERGENIPGGDVLAKLAAIGADVLYILTGQHSIPTDATLSHEEAALLDNYRHSDREGKKSIENVSAAFSQPRPDKKAQ